VLGRIRKKKPPVGAGGRFGFGFSAYFERAPDSSRLAQEKPKNRK